MSKERLDKVIYKAERTALLTRPPKPLVTIPDEDFEWLVEHVKEQAEKLQELRKRYLILTKENNQVNDELIDEFRKNKRYREALEFYAKENNHVFWEDIREGENFVQLPISETDKGYIARKALEGEE